MKPFVTQMSDVSTGRTKWRRRRYQIAEAFADYFPSTEFPDYGAFLTAGGDAMKRERRTRVAIIRRGRRGAPADGISSFVLKVYRYPFIQGIRTGFQISKAQREFDSLRYLNRIGVGAAQAVGYGAERTSLGFVRSCFIITRFVDDSIDLSQWYAEAIRQEEVAGKKIDELFTQLGRMFRRLHQENFFLFTAKPKNILVRNCRNHARASFDRYSLCANPQMAVARALGTSPGHRRSFWQCHWATVGHGNRAILPSLFAGSVGLSFGHRQTSRAAAIARQATSDADLAMDAPPEAALVGKSASIVGFLILTEVTHG